MGWWEKSHNSYFICALLNRARIFRGCASPLNNSLIAGLVPRSTKVILPWSILVQTDISRGSPPVAGVPLASHKPLPRPPSSYMDANLNCPGTACSKAIITSSCVYGHPPRGSAQAITACVPWWVPATTTADPICRHLGFEGSRWWEGGLWGWRLSGRVCGRRCGQKG